MCYMYNFHLIKPSHQCLTTSKMFPPGLQSDCRILPRDVIPRTLLGAASSSAWFGLTFWLPTAQSILGTRAKETKPFSRRYRGFSGTELRIQNFSVQRLKKKPLSALRRRQSPSWHWNQRCRVFPGA